MRSDGTPDLLPRQRGRRPRHGHHPRDPGRGPHRLHPPGAGAARTRSGGGAADPCTRTCRSSSTPSRGPSCRSATARSRSRTSRDAGYLPEALVNYLALLGWAPADDGRRGHGADELVAEFDLDRVTHAAAGFDREKLDWLNGEWIRRLDARRAGRRACSPMARARFGDRRRPRRAWPRRSRSRRSARSRWCRSSTRWRSSSSTTTSSRSTPESWEKVEATDRIARVLDAVIAHVETCDWTHRSARPPAGRSRRSASKPRKAMPALYAAVEGRPRRASAVRLDLAARPRTHRCARLRARSRPPRLTASERADRSATLTATLRGWCNRQHNRFWSCHWGFESSPPSSQQATASAPSSSGLGRRPLKAVTAVRICSGLHPEPGPRGRAPLREVGSARHAMPRDVSALRSRRRRSRTVFCAWSSAFRARATCMRATHARVRSRVVRVARAMRANRMRVRYPPLRDCAVVPSVASCAHARVRVCYGRSSTRSRSG